MAMGLRLFELGVGRLLGSWAAGSDVAGFEVSSFDGVVE
jgi:hypothetical protein